MPLQILYCFRNGRYKKQRTGGDLSLVEANSRSIGQITKKGACVIALRRNISNGNTAGFGATILESMSGQTVRRCEEQAASLGGANCRQGQSSANQNQPSQASQASKLVPPPAGPSQGPSHLHHTHSPPPHTRTMINATLVSPLFHKETAAARNQRLTPSQLRAHPSPNPSKVPSQTERFSEDPPFLRDVFECWLLLC